MNLHTKTDLTLKYVFFDKKIIGLSKMIEACFEPYHKRTVHAVNTLLGVFRNEKLHTFVRNEIANLWSKLETENSQIFWRFLKAFFPLNEIKSLLILQKRIEDTEKVVLSAEDINTDEGKNYQSINDDIITILGGFSHLENLDTALDLFFQYYLKRPDLYVQFYHASTLFFSINKNSAKYGYRTQIAFIKKLVEYAQNGSDPFASLLFCDIADHFLQLAFSPCESTRNDKGIVIYHIPVSLTPDILEYRKPIWDFFMVLASNDFYVKRIKDILRGYGKAIHDCSKDVIKAEAEWICVLTDAVLSPDCLDDCLIAKSLQNIFEAIDYQTDRLDPFFINSKYKLYQIINGPKWKLEFSYEEREQKIKENVQDYIVSTTDRTAAFKNIYALYLESTTGKENNSCDIARGLSIALQMLADNKDDYIFCVTLLLSSEVIEGINTLEIVNNLFSMLSNQELFAHISLCNPLHRNEWLYAYYHELPQCFITQKEVDGLYEFFEDDSDRNLQLSHYRDIDFLDKYLPIDNNVIYEATKIILKKKEYSPFMVTLYFEREFDELNICPHNVIMKYAQDISLLEQIYLFVVEHGHFSDLNGAVLHEIFQVDKSFIRKYAIWFVNKEQNNLHEERNPIVTIFYQEDSYLDIMDFIVDEAIFSSTYPPMTVPRIIKKLLEFSEKDEKADKCDKWIRHFIKNNCSNKKKIQYMFEAIAETSVEQSEKYIVILIEYTDKYDIFEAIPLTHLLCSWSGSCVPMYSKWIDHLKKLLPHFSGLKFIKHKDRVQQLIEKYRSKIKEEEIFDIIEG